MDKLKQTFSRNKESEVEDPTTAGATGRATGQGSHFSSTKTMDRDTLGATGAAQQDSGIGGTMTDPTAAQGTTGPEAGGREHVGTVDPSQLSQPDSAVGQTSTYSTHHLARGDPTPSIVDSRSNDPTTFKKPEGNVGGTASSPEVGVPPNAAQVAASRAFSGSHGEGMPGAFPTDKYENPYRAENLDPRVDNLPIRTKEDKTSSAATAAASSALGGGAISGASTRSAADNTTTTKQAATQEQSQPASGFVGKALAAVGLGGAAGAAGYAATRDGRDSAVGDTALPADATPKLGHSRKESIPTTAYPAGVDSPQAISSPVGGTTRGTEAPRPEEQSHTGRNVAVGAAGLGATGAAGYGASQYATRNDHDPSTFSPASATALGQDNTSKLRDDLASQPSGIAPQAKTSTNDRSTFAPASATILGQDNSSKLRGDLASQPTGISSEAKDRAAPASAASATSNVLPLTDQDGKEDHSKRNTALAAGGAGAAIGGAGAYAATRGDESKSELFGHTAIYGPADTPTTYQPNTVSGQSTTTPTTSQATTSLDQPQRKEEDDHTGRNAALAGAAGAGVVGVGAYAAHDASKKAAEEDTARQAATTEKERAAAEKARADVNKAHKKELEKQEKAAHKDEKKHQKEAEKAQKEAEKKAKKDEKEHQKEAAALEKQRTREEEQRRKQEEEEQDRRKKEAAAAAGAGAVGAGAYAYGKNKDDESSTKSPTKSEEKEKKPGLFKRIFKRRKNKDTGESEDYSSDEEDKSHKGAAAGTAAGAGALGAGAAYAAHERRDDKLDSTTDSASQNIGVARTTDEPTSHYAAASAGPQKPSYNPFARDDPAHQQQQQYSSPTTTSTAAAATTTHQTGTPGYDSQRAAPGTDSGNEFPTEPTTGLAYDPSKEPGAAQRLSEHDVSTPVDTHRTNSGNQGELGDDGEPSSPTSGKKGLRQKLKEKITGHREEDAQGHGDHSVLHKKPHQVPEDVRTSTEGR